MGIIRVIDTGIPIGSGTAIGVNNSVWNVNQVPCGNFCDYLIQNEVVCTQTEMWNNNLCGNDVCYTNPVVAGDCLYFQFQFQNTRNAPNAISYQQFLQRTNPKIPYGWYHNSINPTDWTIRARMWDNCTSPPTEYKPTGGINYADTMTQQASVFLSQNRVASAKTLPINSFYRWTQNIQFCLPSTIPAGFPKEFFFTFEVRGNVGGTSLGSVYSQIFELNKCKDTIQLEGLYTLTDCFGYDYSIPPENSGQPIPNPLLQVLASKNLYANRPAGYRNIHRFPGSAEYTGRLIEKDIPERQCLSIKTSVRDQYRVRTLPLPPYMAEIFNNNLSGRVAYLTGVYGSGTIDVQPNGGITKDTEITRMWTPDVVLNGCECLDFHQC